MKKTAYVVASFLLAGALAAGCGTDENEQPILDTETDTIEENARDLPNKIENVQSMLVDLNTQLGSSANAKEVKKTGESLKEHWSLMEKETEEQYPEDFKAIKESMDPLIEETQKNNPDAEKMKPWIQKAKADLTVLLEKAVKPKKEDEG